MIKKITRFSLVITLLLSLSFFSPIQVYGTNSNPKVNVLIGFNSEPGKSQEHLIESVGGNVNHTYKIIPSIAATIPEAAISNLLRNPNIAIIEPDVTVQATAELDEVWGVERINADDVWATGNIGVASGAISGVKVAVIDSGIDYNHIDLAANYAGGYDFVNNDADPYDDFSHGTHVAGTIAAVANEQGVVGVAPGVEIYALKVLNSSGSGSFSDIIAALDWCLDMGIQVTNNSYGSSMDPGTQVHTAFDNAYNVGIINIASAGNSGNRKAVGDKVGYPAAYSSVVAVAATDQSDARAYFSSTGPAVELSAPGVAIKSTIPGNLYDTYNGTSMASPHVAGTAALIIASGVSGPDQIRTLMQQTAIDLGISGRDNSYGYGLVDAAAAVAAGNIGEPVNTAPTVAISSPGNGDVFVQGETITFAATANDDIDGDLSGDLVWTSNMLSDPIGFGASFESSSLGVGTHTITASVSDNTGLIGSDAITITINESTPSILPVAVVNSIEYSTQGGKGGNAHLLITIGVVEKTGEISIPLSGAIVSVEITLDAILYSSNSGTTSSDGTVTFKFQGAPSGKYITTVTNVFASDLAWELDSSLDFSYIKQ